MDMAAELQSHPLFSTFPPDALAELVRIGSAVAYEPQDICIHQGQQGEVFGVLVRGRLEAVAGHGTPGRRRLGVIEAGECFGEMALLTGNPSMADVMALERSEAIIFQQEMIGPLIARNAEAVKLLTRLITRRLAAPQEPPGPLREAGSRFSLGASSPMRVLAVSCRQEDVRFCYFDTTGERALAWGAVSGLGGQEGAFRYQGPRGACLASLPQASHESALAAALAALTDGKHGVLGSADELSAIGHRVIHGGLAFDSPAVIDEAVKKEIARLSDLAPLDNPYNLRGIEACQKLAPRVPQVAVFDTSFHLKMPQAASRYALPRELSRRPELRRYGFHGISHEGAARAAAAMLGASFDSLRIVSCHLGQGASMTAIDHGRSIDNTMGFTSLEGLVMARRCGDLDPGLVLHLVEREGMAPSELTRRLYHESGLLGLSGVSDDFLAVTEAAGRGEADALLALQVYCQRGKKHLGAYLALLGGADAVVFTGGVGANAPGARARICQGLEFFALILDEEKNRTARVGPGEVAEVSAAQSRVRVLVAGSNEEHTIARQAVRAVAQRAVTDVIRSTAKRIPVSLSAHHVHLSTEHLAALFGPGSQLTWYADLSQPGQYACQEQVSLIGPKGRIDRVRVLGPVRPESQVEISRTEEYKLGIDAPVRQSGDLGGTPGITLEGPCGQVRLAQGVICAMRHIHMSPQDAMEFAVRDRDVVRVRVSGPRSVIFGDVVVRVSPQFVLDMHIDTDEGNAAEADKDSYGVLDSIQQRASAV